MPQEMASVAFGVDDPAPRRFAVPLRKTPRENPLSTLTGRKK